VLRAKKPEQVESEEFKICRNSTLREAA